MIRSLAFIWTVLVLGIGALLWAPPAPRLAATTGALAIVGLLVVWAVPALALALLKPFSEQ